MAEGRELIPKIWGMASGHNAHLGDTMWFHGFTLVHVSRSTGHS